MQRPFSNQLSSRSVSYGANGMVATSHPLATNTGLEILKSGGTAMDAAISANAMLGVVEASVVIFLLSSGIQMKKSCIVLMGAAPYH